MSGKRRRARLQDIASIAEALREPVETPDFTSSILERVHAEKPFIGERTRRWVPVVRIGAAMVSVMCVFAVTLIVFINPELPEKMGAAPSVTTQLFESAEVGVASGLAGVRQGVQELNKAADPLRLVLAADRTPSAPATASPAVFETAPEPAPARLELSAAVSATGAGVTYVTMPLPVAATGPVSLPAVPPADIGFPAADTGALSDLGYRSGYASGALPWQRAAFISQHRAGISFRLPSPPPRLNLGSPVLVKELVPLITGQPAGDDLLIR